MVAIWVIAIAISAVPLFWLAHFNPRAVPAGALLLALVGGMGLALLSVGNAGANPGSAGPVARWWALILGVLVILLVLNLWWIGGPLVQRLNWVMGSMVIWIFVTAVLGFAWEQAKVVRMDRSLDSLEAAQDSAEARVAGHRAELDAAPERRRVALDGTLNGLWRRVAERWGQFHRYIVFGDPATDPGNVVVWVVVTVPPTSYWGAVGIFGEKFHRFLNNEIREKGYPARVAVGFAPAGAVDSAGGDAAYFGPGGANMIPQYPAEFKTYTMRPIKEPERRAAP